MRLAIPCLLVLSASLAAQPLPSVRVSPSLRACTVAQALKHLEESTGVRLRVSPPLDREVVVLKAKDVSMADLMPRLARVLEAEWRREGAVYVLARPRERQRQMEDEAVASRAKALQVAIEGYARELAKLPSVHARAREAIESFRRLMEEHRTGRKAREAARTGWPYVHNLNLPADQLLKQILVALGPQRLAALPLRTRRVYSDAPTRAQAPLPREAAAALREYGDVEEALARLAAEMPEADKYDAEWWKLIQQRAQMRGDGKVLLICERLNPDLLWCLFATHTPDGTLRSRAPLFINLAPPGPAQDALPPAVAALDGQIPLAGLSLEIHEKLPLAATHDYEFYRAPEAVPRASGELVRFVLDPEQNDPLSLTATDAIFGIAERTGASLVARLPDGLDLLARRCEKDASLDLGAFVKAEALRKSVAVELSEGWLLVRPSSSLDCEGRRLSRPVLGRLVRAATREGYLGLRLFARFTYEAGLLAPADSLSRKHRFLLAMTGTEVPGPTTNDLLAELVRFIGSLRDPQWNWLEQGKPLDVGTLTAEQKVLFAEWGSRTSSSAERAPGATAASVPDLLLNGTEAMPDGPRMGTLFWMRSFPVPVVERVSVEWPVKHLIGIPLGPLRLGEILANHIDQKMIPSMPRAMAGKWRHGTQGRFEFSSEIARGVLLKGDGGDRTKLGKDALSFSELPEAIRKEIEREVARSLKEIP